MPRSRDRRLRAQRIGLVASVVAVAAIGLVALSGNYLPRGQALLLLERLQRVDRRFQERSRLETVERCRRPRVPRSATNGSGSSTASRH
jgi:hypothetical protein